MIKTRTYTVVLRAVPQADDPQGLRRLRHALKALLRSFGLRCLSVAPYNAQDDAGRTFTPDIAPASDQPGAAQEGRYARHLR